MVSIIIALLNVLPSHKHQFKVSEKVKHKILTISAKVDEYRIKGETEKIHKLIKEPDIKNTAYYVIEGRVYDQNLNPIAGGYYIYIYNAYTGDFVSNVYPDLSGEYIDTLPAGAYIIQAKGDEYPVMYYSSHGSTGSIDSAEVVWLLSDTDSINIVAPPANVIKGVLYDDSTSLPISNAYGSVEVIDTVTKSLVWKPLSTDTLGNYVIGGLNKGVFKIRYYVGGYVHFYYGNTYNWFDATPVIYSNWGDTLSGIDVYLPPISSGPTSGQGAITGRLLTDTGDTIKDPYPYAVVMDASTGDFMFASFEYDTSTGVYTFSELPTGTYKILIDPNNYVPQYYNDKPDFESADPIYVHSPDTVYNIDFNFHKGGAISGYITGLDGSGYTGAFYLDVYNSRTGDFVYTYSGSTPDGNYVTGTDLATDTYKIHIYPVDIGTGQWYKDAYTFEDADDVYVTAPDTTENINFDFTGWNGIISGIVQNEDSAQLYASIELYKASTQEFVASSYSDMSGFYIRNLPPGDYKLYIQPLGWDSLYYFYIEQWYNGQTSWDDANTIHLTQGDSIFLTITLSEGGKIVGSINDSTTHVSISQKAYPFIVLIADQTSPLLKSARMGDFRGYSTEPLSPGDYKLIFLPTSYYDTLETPPMVYNPYHFEFYENSTTYHDANTISVIRDSVLVKDINTTKVNGAIEGSVMNGSYPVRDSFYEVIAVNPEGYPVALFYTADTFKYHIGGLLPGTYYLYLWPYGLWYNQVYSPIDVERVPYPIPPTATPITVNNSTVLDINFDITGIHERNINTLSAIHIPTLLNSDRLSIKGTMDINEIQIYDLSGRRVLRKYNNNRENHMTIEVKGLKKGVYFIILKKANGNTITRKKFIKVK